MPVTGSAISLCDSLTIRRGSWFAIVLFLLWFALADISQEDDLLDKNFIIASWWLVLPFNCNTAAKISYTLLIAKYQVACTSSCGMVAVE